MPVRLDPIALGWQRAVATTAPRHRRPPPAWPATPSSNPRHRFTATESRPRAPQTVPASHPALPCGHSVLEPPLPIPNRTVKRDRADDSAATRAKVGHRKAPLLVSPQPLPLRFLRGSRRALRPNPIALSDPSRLRRMSHARVRPVLPMPACTAKSHLSNASPHLGTCDQHRVRFVVTSTTIRVIGGSSLAAPWLA